MKAIPQVDEGLTSLEDRLQVRILILQSKLAGQYTTEEIEAEVREIQELVNDFGRLDRWFEKLLDPATPTSEIRQIAEQLPGSAKKIAEDREALRQIHSVSHQLIARSVFLVTNAQRLVDKAKDLTGRYAAEVCGFCDGFGRTKESVCPSCRGKGSVLVHQPALKCPRCEGSGKADRCDPSVRCYGLCTVCLGSGWALTNSKER